MTETFVFVLYGCKCLSHALAKEHKLRGFEDRVLLRKLLGPNG